MITHGCERMYALFINTTDHARSKNIKKHYIHLSIHNIKTHTKNNILASKVLDLVPKYHTLEQTWPRSSVGRALDYPKARSRVRLPPWSG